MASGVSAIGLAFMINPERLWAYIFVFCIIPIIVITIRLDYHVQPHKIEL